MSFANFKTTNATAVNGVCVCNVHANIYTDFNEI